MISFNTKTIEVLCATHCHFRAEPLLLHAFPISNMVYCLGSAIVILMPNEKLSVPSLEFPVVMEVAYSSSYSYCESIFPYATKLSGWQIGMALHTPCIPTVFPIPCQ